MQDFEDIFMWTNSAWQTIPISELETSHLQKILEGFSSGLSFGEQDSKEQVIKLELRLRAIEERLQ